MAIPADQYLLSADDATTIDQWLADGAPRRDQPSWTTICAIDHRLLQLLIEEARAKSLASGKRVIEVSELAPERRAVFFVQAFAGGASCNGLAQTCGDQEQDLLLAIEGMKMIAPEPLATDLTRFMDMMRRGMSESREFGTASPETMVLSSPEIDDGLEQRVWDANWVALCMRHVLRHRTLFFRQSP